MYIKGNFTCAKCEALKIFKLEEKSFDLIYKKLRNCISELLILPALNDFNRTD